MNTERRSWRSQSKWRRAWRRFSSAVAAATSSAPDAESPSIRCSMRRSDPSTREVLSMTREASRNTPEISARFHSQR